MEVLDCCAAALLGVLVHLLPGCETVNETIRTIQLIPIGIVSFREVDRQIFSWGSGSYGRLGLGPRASQPHVAVAH